jgi:hypothetical protein
MSSTLLRRSGRCKFSTYDSQTQLWASNSSFVRTTTIAESFHSWHFPRVYTSSKTFIIETGLSLRMITTETMSYLEQMLIRIRGTKLSACSSSSQRRLMGCFTVQWEIRKLHNGTYLIRNQQFRNHASYKITDDVGDLASVLSIRTGDPRRWNINSSNGFYRYIEFHIPLTHSHPDPRISDLDGSRCWTLRQHHPETPVSYHGL